MVDGKRVDNEGVARWRPLDDKGVLYHDCGGARTIYAWDKITQNYTHAEDQCQLSNANITAMKM